MSAISIRPERGTDQSAIHALTEAAFAESEHSDGSEPAIVDNLRADGDLALSLVAEDGQRIVGHIAISPIAVGDGVERWYGIGPVSILPELQRQGIGSRLIERAIADLRLREAGGIVVLGDPAYYTRFGFEHDAALIYPGPPPEYFQRLVLDGPAPRGVVTYAAAFR